MSTKRKLPTSPHTIEDTDQWSTTDWLDWMKSTIPLYYGHSNYAFDDELFLPFITTRHRNIAPQLFDQVSLYAPKALLALGEAAKTLAMRWSLVDGYHALLSFVRLAGLVNTRDLQQMVFTVDGTIPLATDPKPLATVFAAISDDVIPRMTPQEVYEVALHIINRRKDRCDFAFQARCVETVLKSSGMHQWQDVLAALMPSIEFLQNLPDERRFLIARLKAALGDDFLQKTSGTNLFDDQAGYAWKMYFAIISVSSNDPSGNAQRVKSRQAEELLRTGPSNEATPVETIKPTIH